MAYSTAIRPLLYHLVVTVTMATISKNTARAVPLSATTLRDLAHTEATLVTDFESALGSLAGDTELSADLEYFLDFLKTDSNSTLPDLENPISRFKLVERILYDWPQLVPMWGAAGLPLSLPPAFLPITNVHLLATVRDINDIVSVYGDSSPRGVTYELLQSGSPLRLPTYRTVPLNTGNTFILTNMSRDLGQVGACVAWGEITDRDLVTAVEPFAVPGEEYWVQFYITFLECLVTSGHTSKHKIKINEIKNDILLHYPHLRKVLKKILKLEVVAVDTSLEPCRSVPNTSLRSPFHFCEFIHVSPLERLKADVLREGVVLVHGESSCDRIPLSPRGAALLCNEGHHPQRVVLRHGNVTLQPGHVIMLEREEFVRACPLAYGQPRFRYRPPDVCVA